MVEVVPPGERRCERCGRHEVWDDGPGSWVLADDGDADPGTPHCLHDWNINGTYNPISE